MKLFSLIPILFFCNLIGFGQNPELLLQKGHSKKINTIKFSPKGNFFATGSDDNLVILTDAITGISYKEFTGHTEPVLNILFTSDGKKMITASKEETIVWNLETEKKLWFSENGINDECAAAITANNLFYLYDSYGNHTRLINLVTGEETKPETNFNDHFNYFFYTADGKSLLAITEEKVFVLDAITYEQKFIFGTQQIPRCFFVTRDSKYYYCAKKCSKQNHIYSMALEVT